MFSLTNVLSSLIFITAVHSLVPPSRNPTMNLALSSTPLSLMNLNSSSTASGARFVNASDNVECKGSFCGYDPNPQSCRDALDNIPKDPGIFYWGSRSKGTFERPLPHRYLSGKCRASFILDLQFSSAAGALGDGLCAVDVLLTRGFDYDKATNLEIFTAGESILQNCVLQRTRQRTMGGYANRRGNYNLSHLPLPFEGFLFAKIVWSGYSGEYGGLSVKLSTYSANVQCVPEPEFTDGGGCSKIVDTMPSAHSKHFWTRERDGRPRIVFVPLGGKHISSGTYYTLPNCPPFLLSFKFRF